MFRTSTIKVAAAGWLHCFQEPDPLTESGAPGALSTADVCFRDALRLSYGSFWKGARSSTEDKEDGIKVDVESGNWPGAPFGVVDRQGVESRQLAGGRWQAQDARVEALSAGVGFTSRCRLGWAGPSDGLFWSVLLRFGTVHVGGGLGGRGDSRLQDIAPFSVESHLHFADCLITSR